jgi:ubiquinone/menaquinone biosynthesis C-methylase UbiE
VRLKDLYRSNGPGWTARYVLYQGASHTAQFFGRATRSLERRMKEFETEHQLHGENTPDANRDTWTRWDWSKGGEEWTPRPAWKQSFCDEVIHRYLDERKTIVEIGPGAGRWTETLQQIAARLVIVDITPRCIEMCKERFADARNIEYHVNDGATLPFLESGSVDAVFSHDVFVHIAPPETRAYLQEFSRVLAPGGIGVVHHPDVPSESTRGWRSSVTASMFAGFLEETGLKLERQFDRWGTNGMHVIGDFPDQISVFTKP